MQSLTDFVHLRVHSAYSLAEGAIRTKDLVKLCSTKNMPAVAVTDTNNMFGAMEFALEAAGSGIQPIVGAQVDYISPNNPIVLLVQSEEGYRNLCRLVSAAYMEGGDNAVFFITPEKLKAHGEGLICLTGGALGPIGQSILQGQMEKAEEEISFLKSVFGDRLYIELQRHGMADEKKAEPHFLNMAEKFELPIVATNDCFFGNSSMYEAHDALLCIAEGRYVSETDRRKVTPNHYFKSRQEMLELFSDLPDATENTVEIAKRCHYFIQPIQPILPPFETDSGRNENEELKQQAKDGLAWRLENFIFTPDMDEAERTRVRKEHEERLDFELNTIIQMGFPGYFLIVSDFIRWAKSKDIPVGPGRGSGAGSLVAYSLSITDLPPIQFGLLFERMLNPERVSMPDFDVDFCQDRRDEVITYVQERYGYDRVAQIITFGKLQARAVLRDVGRVLQIGYGQVDKIAKMIPANPANPVTLAEALEGDAELRAARDGDDAVGKLINIALQLEGLYRHASTHAAGVVIGDRPLQELLPMYRDPRSPMPVTQFNMKYVEKAGLVKFDFLGLKTLTVIQKAVQLVKKVHDTDLDILKIPLDDRPTYDLLSSGSGVGVFQLESGGMRSTLRAMKPNRFEDIIALVALYRPGPMDNIPKYISVKEGKEEPDYLHPKLQVILEETFGIMIYQEQVMQAAQLLSGYTLGGADLLRRAMGKKIKEEMDDQREKFVTGAEENSQVSAERASSIFDVIEKFAGYGFNKSHAAAYALIAYQTAWLKANYPVEFMAASMTLDKGNTDKLAIFKQELDHMDIVVRSPDINLSGVDFEVEEASIRYALSALKGVGEAAMQALVADRLANGEYRSLKDFLTRLEARVLNRRQWEALVAAGAFDGLHPNRAQLHENGELLLSYASSLAEDRNSGQESLFGGGAADCDQDLPPLPDVKGWDSFTKLGNEFAAVGFYLSAHPLDSKQSLLTRLGVTLRAELEEKVGGEKFFKMAGVLLKKQEKMSAKGNKFAILIMSDPTGVYEVMIYSELLLKMRDQLVEGTNFLLFVEGDRREDQLRLLSTEIKLLDTVAEDKIREVIITLDSPKAIAPLKELVAESKGRGRVKIMLWAGQGDAGRALIRLPDEYTLKADLLPQLDGVAGVASYEEV